MLEQEMEVAVANCPELFIEPGLTLIRRQALINGRRPDVLFSDGLARHLLVEIQRGRLDEDHLQRHFYYYFDYRAKYPSIHLRLMFIANRLVPQHKEFLDEHGYEFREYPEHDFDRRVHECSMRKQPSSHLFSEVVETPGILPPATHELLFEIEKHPMTLCYKMLLLLYMADCADDGGRVALRFLAERFQTFFVERVMRAKAEENPKVVQPGNLSRRTLSEWERVIRDQPVRYLTTEFVIDEGTSIRWADRIWSRWSPVLKSEIHSAALDRLRRYFERNVPGGY
jgi:Endonuclease NucS